MMDMHTVLAAPSTQASTEQIARAPQTTQPAADAKELALLTQAAVKFEAFFVAQMLKQMRQSTAALADEDSPLRDEVNQAPLAMADNAVADDLAAQRAFGIADVLVRQMSAALPSANASTSLNTAAEAARRNM